ncbi:hypothetical protein GCM10011610_40500 [Nocardia rhizosphaerihabitans]|uniref:Uncharacterized protein n=1 Tax=Nocardia rhizosphaerihabitans TaxID=1691570 RepID=A0ABQ2KLX8_9NOCA|nr:hypothetical protein GCM10011610_40500 [Nocardia rhizosphaerihabitans]
MSDVTGSDDDPDVPFALGPRVTEPASAPDPADAITELAYRIARESAALGPAGWRELTAVFALTVAAEVTHLLFEHERGTVRVAPTEDILAAVREHRKLSAGYGDGPWWRLVVSMSSAGRLDVDHDYGDEPFPADQLFAPQVYLADLAAHPRDRLPVWLAAYLHHGDRQRRAPGDAARLARADAAAGVRATMSEFDFPPYPLLRARWAVIAAAFAAAGSARGPRMLPALGWFEGGSHSGSTVFEVPGGRAVLSGGVWNAAALEAGYNEGAELPALYAGAPDWVADPVLNTRAGQGLLSFCYWWDNGTWYRGESPAADHLAEAVPGIWTADTATRVVAGLLGDEASERQRSAARALVEAAERGIATRAEVVEVFGVDDTFDVDTALYQLTLAGVTADAAERAAR